MPKLILRAALAGCATAGLAAAQTPPPPPIQVAPPVPSQPVASPMPPQPVAQTLPQVAVPSPVPVQGQVYTFRAVSPTQAKMVLKTFDVADLVCPPADSPLAKPGTDPAMIAAAKAFAEVRGQDVLKVVRADDTFHMWGTMEFTTDGKTLVVNCPEPVADKVAARLETLRKLHHSSVKVDMVLFTVPSKTEAVAKLFGEKATAAVKADEFNAVLRELKASGAVDILTRPTLVMTNKQTGFFQVGQPVTVPGAVACTTVGTTARVTPDVSADLKTVLLALDVQHSDCTGGKVDCQQTQTKLVMPDGGTMLVKVGTRTMERRVETKVPVMSDIPYMNRLFKNVGVSSEPTDVVAVVTVTRVADAPCASPMVVTPTAMPYAVPLAAPAPVMPSPVIRTVGADGLERLGVDFNTLTAPVALPPAVQQMRVTAPAGTHVTRFVAEPPTSGVVSANGDWQINRAVEVRPAVAGGVIGTTLRGDDTAAVMAAYKAACAAGRTDEAARLAMQLLAKDPTCFGK